MKAISSLILSGIAAATVSGEDMVERRCREFLTHLSPVHTATTGTQVAFTGSFAPIPVLLTHELEQQFPEYRFRIANMIFWHWGPEPMELLLVLDRESNIRSFLWEGWFAEAPPAFGDLFVQQGQPPEVAQARITALAKLIGFQTGWTVGSVTTGDGLVSVPLIDSRNRVKQILRSRFTPDFPAEPLAIVQPDEP